MTRLAIVALGLALGAGAQEKLAFKVKLVSPLDTKVNKVGDKITAEVLSPDEYKGAFVNGKVREAKSSGKVKGASVLGFSFDTLVQNEQETPIQSRIDSIANSQGREDMDEEGRLIKKTNNTAHLARGAAEGAGIGGLMRGRAGAAAGAAAGTAASFIIVQLAAEGAAVRLDPGSELMMSVEIGRKD